MQCGARSARPNHAMINSRHESSNPPRSHVDDRSQLMQVNMNIRMYTGCSRMQPVNRIPGHLAPVPTHHSRCIMLAFCLV